MDEEKGQQSKKRGKYQYKPTNKAISLYLMDQIYRPRYCALLNGFSIGLYKNDDRSDENDSLSQIDNWAANNKLVRNSAHIYLGTGNKIEGEEITDRDVRQLFFRDNNIPGIVEFLKSKEEEYRRITFNNDSKITALYHNLWYNIPADNNGKFKPPAEYHTLKKMLDNEDLFEKTDSVSRLKNLKQYFPKEDKDTFVRFIRSLKSAKALENFDEYSRLFSTRYMHICLNKQFVLDILKDNNIVINYHINDDISDHSSDTKGRVIERTHNFKLIFSGRFRKRYEIKNSVNKMIQLFEELREKCYECREININEFLKQKRYQFDFPDIADISDDRIDDFIKEIENTLRYLKEDRCARASFSDESVIAKFDTDPEGTYREEDPWSDVIDFDTELIDKIEVTTITKYRGELSEKEVMDLYSKYGEDVIIPDHKISLSEERTKLQETIDVPKEYPVLINNVITPILSLIQFSPSALFYFVCEQDEWASKTKNDHNNSDETDFDYLDFINKMTKKALRDYMNDKTIERVFPIKCSIVGNILIKDEIKPSVLTFTAEEGCNIMFTWSEDPNDHRQEKIWPVIEGHKCYDEQLLKIMKICSSTKYETFYDCMKSLVFWGGQYGS